jgi:hypothetical protein
MKKILLLGSGELGKEFVISAKRLGAHVVACDSYAGAPAMQVADEFRVFSMLDADKLKAAIEEVKPDLIVPEIEAIRTEVLIDAESQGYQVIPSARAANLTMNRDRIRDLAVSLGVRTAKFAYAESVDTLKAEASKIGYPVVIKLRGLVGGPGGWRRRTGGNSGLLMSAPGRACTMRSNALSTFARTVHGPLARPPPAQRAGAGAVCRGVVLGGVGLDPKAVQELKVGTLQISKTPVYWLEHAVGLMRASSRFH